MGSQGNAIWCGSPKWNINWNRLFHSLFSLVARLPGILVKMALLQKKRTLKRRWSKMTAIYTSRKFNISARQPLIYIGGFGGISWRWARAGVINLRDMKDLWFWRRFFSALAWCLMCTLEVSWYGGGLKLLSLAVNSNYLYGPIILRNACF